MSQSRKDKLMSQRLLLGVLVMCLSTSFWEVCWCPCRFVGEEPTHAEVPSGCHEPKRPEEEPNYNLASQWWPELENVWTPIGWKDHCVRFNVLYNGSIIVGHPTQARNFMRRLKSIIGSGIQLDFSFSIDEQLPGCITEPFKLSDKDGGIGCQRWAPTICPLLCSTLPKDEVVIRQLVFAHLMRGSGAAPGVEPLFAWVRLEPVRIPSCKERKKNTLTWFVRITKPHIQTSMSRSHNLVAVPADGVIPGRLSLADYTGVSRSGWLLRGDSWPIILAVLAPPGWQAKLVDRRRECYDVLLAVKGPLTFAAKVDLLLPAFPVEREIVEAELELGFQGALAEAEYFWSRVPVTAAKILTPENPINEAITRGVQLAQMLTIRHPDTGQYTLITGSWRYEALWSTFGAMVISMVFDTLGYHEEAEKYLEVFLQEQGKVKPPGAAYSLHPGYLGTPRIVESVDWLSDHGAILHAASYHALLTNNREFITRWLPAIISACEFICESTRQVGHGGIEGILPAGRGSDMATIGQWVWNDGWNYKGLCTAVQLLERLGHPQAEHFRTCAEEWRRRFWEVFTETGRKMRHWRSASGEVWPLAPTALPEGGDVSHPFYLDTGPLFLIFAGLVPPANPWIEGTLRYFREGPNHQFLDPRGEHPRPPCLFHEISSCEPAYSWNVFHSHAVRDRARFLEGMYSLFAGGMSRQTYISSETRGGISGGIYAHPLAIYCARLAVIDDIVSPEEIHLLRLVPRAWLSASRETIFENIPTVFGPVSLRFQLSHGDRSLEVKFTNDFHHPPRRIVLHLPPGYQLGEVCVNGKRFPVSENDWLDLTQALGAAGSD